MIPIYADLLATICHFSDQLCELILLSHCHFVMKKKDSNASQGVDCQNAALARIGAAHSLGKVDLWIEKVGSVQNSIACWEGWRLLKQHTMQLVVP